MKAKLILASLFAASISASAVTVDFEDLGLAADSYYKGADSAGGFTSRGVGFSNNYDTTYGSWDGFAYSNLASVFPTVSDYNDQFSLAATGNAAGNTYGIAYQGYTSAPTISLDNATSTPLSISITNTSYAWASMTYGDGFAKQFTTGDWFKLTITALNSIGSTIGSVETFLADFTDGNAYILDNWTVVDLSSLGESVAFLSFTFSSSDNGTWGMNTPAYVAIDNFVAVPEPSTYAALAGLAVLGMAVYRKRRQA